MKFRQFIKWCNDRACDGCWDMLTAITCSDLIDRVRKIPFWKREKYWRDNYEKPVLKGIITPLENKIKELRG